MESAYKTRLTSKEQLNAIIEHHFAATIQDIRKWLEAGQSMLI